MTNEKRNEQIIKFNERGWSNGRIAERYGITEARVSQIVTAHKVANHKPSFSRGRRHNAADSAALKDKILRLDERGKDRAYIAWKCDVSASYVCQVIKAAEQLSA